MVWMLDEDLLKGRWIVCLGRVIKIHTNADDEVYDLVAHNLDDLSNLPYWDCNPRRDHYVETNKATKTIIQLYKINVSSLSQEDAHRKDYISQNFFHYDGKELPNPFIARKNKLLRPIKFVLSL